MIIKRENTKCDRGRRERQCTLGGKEGRGTGGLDRPDASRKPVGKGRLPRGNTQQKKTVAFSVIGRKKPTYVSSHGGFDIHRGRQGRRRNDSLIRGKWAGGGKGEDFARLLKEEPRKKKKLTKEPPPRGKKGKGNRFPPYGRGGEKVVSSKQEQKCAGGGNNDGPTPIFAKGSKHSTWQEETPFREGGEATCLRPLRK